MPQIDRSVVRHGVTVSGMTRERDVDHAFVLNIFRAADKSGEYVTDKHLRYSGSLMGKARLKLLGMHGNVKLTADFFDILNIQGRQDPVNAAGVIARCVNAAIHVVRDMESHQKWLGDDCLVQLLPSNMAAGPCQHSITIGGRSIPAASAPLLPLTACDRPGQCGCLYTLAP